MLLSISLKTVSVGSNSVNSIVSDQSKSVYIQVLLYAILLIVLVGLFFYLLDIILKYLGIFQGGKIFLKKNYFLILIFFPFFYLVYYYAYYLPFKNTNISSIWIKEETADFLWTASLTFLGTGVASGTIKWMNNLAFFKRQFTELIKSKAFNDVISDKMKDLALSDDYLLQRNDLENIWKRVTICKYQQKFPELSQEIGEKIENDLYLERSLHYYYKNFRVQINFTLEGDIIKIVEIASFTVISSSTDKIEVNFGTTSDIEDNDAIYTRFIPEFCKCDGKKLELKTYMENEIGDISANYTRFKAELSGKKKYIIERQIELTQNITDDRVFTFSSSRIIEDLSINLKHDNNLKLFFSPVGKNVFDDDNHLRGERSISYISRDLLLPGEKFKVFIYKKG
jgi:hypothetical protein